ncbi:DUF115 domain-containing protein [bacterium]|nr:DUF115 domain-containing protein [bacterium]MBU1990611.1 DUF115 domain-containing protein [bacterium]
MQEIELQAMRNYENNLKFLSNNNPSLFKKIQLFDLGQENEDLQARYDLEYKENYFDVKDIASNNYLYNMDSIKYSQQVAQNINYKKTSFLFNGMLDYEISKEQMQKIQEQKAFAYNNIKDILPIMKYAMELAPKSTTMKHIDKFIFIGTGLGLHIADVHRQIHSTEYLIIEDDLELFRLSLFTTAYHEIAQDANLHFSISKNENEFTAVMAGFLEGSFFNNRYIKYFHFPAHSTNKMKLIQNNLATQTHQIFPYDIQLEKCLRPLKRIKQEYKTIDISKKFPESAISQKPLLILAAGPSMKKNLDWLKTNKDKFIILAVTAVLKTLHDNNIKPDIVTHIDGVESEGNSCMVHFEGFNAKEFLKDSLFILGSHTPNSVLDLVKKENVFFFESFTFYFKNFGSLSTPCIGSTSTVLSLWLNAKEIYLLGLDLALDQETGATHSGDHEYNATHDLSNTDEIDYTISLRNNLIPIKGNFSKTVFSTPIFIASVQSLYNNIPQIIDDSQTIYNLNDGAYFYQTTPLKIENINKYKDIDKKDLAVELNALFNSKSKSKLDQEDMASLKKRLNNAKEVQKNFQEYENKNFTNEEAYLYDLLGIVSSTLKYHGREGNNLTLVFASYFQYTLPYIVDVINTKEVTKIMKHLKKLDKMFVDGSYNILHRYIQEIEEFFNT